MAKKKPVLTLGLTRQELKDTAMKLGKTQKQVNKANSKYLENFIRKNDSKYGGYSTSKKVDTDFRFGIGRGELKKLAKDLGKKGNLSKNSTKQLEKFIENKMIGKGHNVELSKEMKNDVKAFFENDYHKGKSYLNEKLARVANVEYANMNALRNVVAKEFSVFYEGLITDKMISEIINRLEYAYIGEAFNGLINTLEYRDILENYSNEVKNKENIEDE